MRVLMVDDSEPVRKRICERIRAIPGVTQVDEDEGGAAALTRLSDDPPDLMVLDLQMPGTSGFRVLAEARHPSSPVVIILTNSPEYREHCLRRGAAFFFDKATEVDALLETIQLLAMPSAPPVARDRMRDLAHDIVQRVATPMLVLDARLHVYSANRAFLEQFVSSREEVAGRALNQIQGFRFDMTELHPLLLCAAREGHAVRTFDAHAVGADGSARVFVVTAERLATDVADTPSLLLLQLEDVTARRRSEETLDAERRELARSNAALGEFAHAASHDLQEPLRKVIAFTDRVASRYGALLPEDGLGYLSRISNATLRMRSLIEGMLACALAAGEHTTVEAVNLDALVQEVLTDLEMRIEEVGARIEVTGLPSVDADRFQMRQLIQNLLSNAIRFRRTEVPTRITISASVVAGTMELRVADNGIGFEERYRERIFGMFMRLHGREQYHGSGIGLALCRTIAERHRGSIVAHSRPGEGSTFVVTLPLSQARKSAMPLAVAS